MKKLVPLFLLSLVAFGQNNEIGGGFGGSFYNSKDITVGSTSVDAGFKNGFSGSFWATQNTNDRFGGEIRYTYARGAAKLSGANSSASFSSESHAVGYDLLYYFKARQQRIRPYVLAGAGVKVFRGTGQERAAQALSNFGFLTRTNQSAVYVSFGAGVKYQISPKWNFRVEIRDVTSPFPSEVIATASLAKRSGGWLHNVAPTFGVSYLF
jgi:hypothetical protein